MTALSITASDSFPTALIIITGVIGLLFAYLLYQNVARIRVGHPVSKSTEGGEGNGYLLADSTPVDENEQKCQEIQIAIADGANSFLYTEYRYMMYFMIIFGLIVFLLLSSAESKELDSSHREYQYIHHKSFSEKSIANGLFTTISFLLGGCTSILSGFLGMRIATYANARTTLTARNSLEKGFLTAFKSGAVMGFTLTSCGLLVLFVTIYVFKGYFGLHFGDLFEAIAGYGLGGSSIALFGRVGGGIYTKAADVGADLVGKVEQNIPEDDPRNPGVIADNVGDNVGDIAGMGADLFGSFAESTCAALVVASLSDFGGYEFNDELSLWVKRYSHDGKHHEVYMVSMMFPLMVTAVGILSSLITAQLVLFYEKVDDVKKIEPTLKRQLIVSTLLMTPLVLGLAYLTLPKSFDIYVSDTERKKTESWRVFFCVGVGLWSGMLIGILTEYYTSNRYEPTRTVADSTRTGAATNIIFGLALGYKSCIVPIICLAVSIYISYTFAAMFGVACAALGMLGTLATGLTIDAYGPISDNAGGIAEMSGMGESVRERTDALDAAGNTTAAIGKGFAIGSAALVSLALFGAYVTRAGISNVNIIHPAEFAGLIYGAMLPYWFSALTMKSVGIAALSMVEEVRRQFRTISGLMEGTADPDYRRCVEISTEASLREMIAPGALVMLSPIVIGLFFGPATLAGMLAGALVSGVQMAISAANTGGAWDNAKKYVEAGASEHARSLGGKGSECHKAAVIGDTVGDPLKDTSGPALNILIKLMAVESLVFAPFIKAHGGLIFK